MVLSRLGTFSIAPICCLSRLPHLSLPSLQDQTTFIHLWRYIGFYMGVSPEILRAHFSTLEQATKFLASTTLHLVPMDDESKESMKHAPTMPIIRAISNRQPFPATFEHNSALTRFLVGDTLADQLLVPRTSAREAIKLRLRLIYERIPQWFGEFYPRAGWRKERHVLTRVAMARIIRWQLGMRRTQFRPRNADSGELVYPDDKARNEEAIVPDYDGAKVMMRRWKWLVYEMLAVCGVGVALVALSLWTCVSRLQAYNVRDFLPRLQIESIEL
jgi:hypothetical protein